MLIIMHCFVTIKRYRNIAFISAMKSDTSYLRNYSRFCSALLRLLMMTPESMLSKRPVLGISVILFFLHKNFRLIFVVNCSSFTTALQYNNSFSQHRIVFSRFSQKLPHISQIWRFCFVQQNSALRLLQYL